MGARVLGADGFRAEVARLDGTQVELRHADGVVVVPASMLHPDRDGFAIDSNPARSGEDSPLVVPIVAEALDVEREKVTTGAVRISKRVSEHDVIVDEPVFHEEVEVRRHPVNRTVAEAPPIRQEGDTTIVPVLEETLVVERRLMLREELHIRRVRVESHAPQRVTLKREYADVERIDASTGDAS